MNENYRASPVYLLYSSRAREKRLRRPGQEKIVNLIMTEFIDAVCMVNGTELQMMFLKNECQFSANQFRIRIT